jgi:hypothetical protein
VELVGSEGDGGGGDAVLEEHAALGSGNRNDVVALV